MLKIMDEDKRPRLRWLDESCHVCGRQLNSWDARCTKALGYRHKTCEMCIAKEYGRTKEEFRETLEDFFGMRPCQGI